MEVFQFKNQWCVYSLFLDVLHNYISVNVYFALSNPLLGIYLIPHKTKKNKQTRNCQTKPPLEMPASPCTNTLQQNSNPTTS